MVDSRTVDTWSQAIASYKLRSGWDRPQVHDRHMVTKGAISFILSVVIYTHLAKMLHLTTLADDRDNDMVTIQDHAYKA